MRRYWEGRYSRGGTSGAGSYGEEADIKAAFINHFVDAHDVISVVDWGCGDGEQLSRLAVSNYVGVDVSASALEMCRYRNRQHGYVLDVGDDDALALHADLSMSLDVVYHFPTDDEYRRYLTRVFEAGDRFVIVYATNYDVPPRGHMRHRQWVDDVPDGWRMVEWPTDPRRCGFYVFERDQ